MSKFVEGQKVRIREGLVPTSDWAFIKDLPITFYYMEDKDEATKNLVTPIMSTYCGKEATIEEVDIDPQNDGFGYRLSEDNGRYWWVDDMLEAI